MGAHVHDASRWILSCLLGLSAAAKLLTPYQDSYVVPETLYYLGGIVELGAAVVLHTRYRRYGLATTVALALVGITLAAAVPGRLCGCLGSLLPLEGTAHVLVSGILGALACLGFGPMAREVMRPPV